MGASRHIHCSLGGHELGGRRDQRGNNNILSAFHRVNDPSKPGIVIRRLIQVGLFGVSGWPVQRYDHEQKINGRWRALVPFTKVLWGTCVAAAERGSRQSEVTIEPEPRTCESSARMGGDKPVCPAKP